MLPLRNNERKFGWLAQLLHWIMAIAIIGMIVVGLNMVTLPLSSDKLKIYGWHKSTGILIFFFLIFRFTWRQMNFQPHVPHENGRGFNYPPLIYKTMDFFAHYWHIVIYILLFIMPITGWLMTSSFGLPVSVFGWFTMPNLVLPNKENAKLFQTIHDWTSYLLIFFITVHILAGLFHHYVLKDIVMKRMLPVLALVLLATPALAAQQFEVNKAKSYIKFEAVQNGAPAVGEFPAYKAQIAFGKTDLSSSKAVIDIDMNGVSSTYDELITTLKGAEWFDVKQFPAAKFESEKFTSLGGDNYNVDGKLTIKGKTNPLQMHFTMKQSANGEAIVEGETTISRSSFGVGWKDISAVKDDVKIKVHVEAAPTK